MTDGSDQGSVRAAVAVTVTDLPVLSSMHGALVEIALSLASSIDMRAFQGSAQAGLATAALARELRSTLELLTKGVDDDTSDSVDRLIARLSAPVRDTQD